jgi:hypothetical protein
MNATMTAVNRLDNNLYQDYIARYDIVLLSSYQRLYLPLLLSHKSQLLSAIIDKSPPLQLQLSIKTHNNPRQTIWLVTITGNGQKRVTYFERHFPSLNQTKNNDKNRFSKNVFKS